jgi:hypothetical protein
MFSDDNADTAAILWCWFYYLKYFATLSLLMALVLLTKFAYLVDMLNAMLYKL